MVFILILFLLFAAAFLFLAAADRRETSHQISTLEEQLKRLTLLGTQLEEWKLLNKKQMERDLMMSRSSPGQLTTTQQAQFDEYRKRGGTDNEETWLQKSEMYELFP